MENPSYFVLVMQCPECESGINDYHLYGPFNKSEADHFMLKRKNLASTEKSRCGKSFIECGISHILKPKKFNGWSEFIKEERFHVRECKDVFCDNCK